MKTLKYSCLKQRYRKFQQMLDFVLSKYKILFNKIKLNLIRPPFPANEDSTVNLHLGCGSINHPKFINIDGIPAPHIHYVRSIDDLSPFSDKKVDLIYASHCLEHFRYKEVPCVLSEWFRVLKVGGILRLSVPDFDCLLKVYFDNNRDIDSIVEQLLAGQRSKYDYHLSFFNYRKLEKLLKNTGFKEVRCWIPNSDEYTTFNDFSVYHINLSDKRYPVSLNLEAVK